MGLGFKILLGSSMVQGLGFRRVWLLGGHVEVRKNTGIIPL